MDDAELIAASRRGDAVAFGRLVERHQRAVLAVSHSGTRDVALGEDVAQDTFVIAWRELGRLRDAARLRPWLCGIARNLARKARRARARDREAPIEELAADGTPFELVGERQAEAAVTAALARVHDKYREALVLYYYEQRSIGEVAAALGVSEHAAYQRLSRGRQQLADGVAHLVERTLERRRPKRELVAAVLAAIVLPSHHAEAATKGASMKTIGIAVSVAVAVGTGGYFVQQSLGKTQDDTTSRPTSTTSAVNAPAKPPVASAVASARLAALPALAKSSPADVTGRRQPSTHAHADCATATRHMASLMRDELRKKPMQGPEEMFAKIVDKLTEKIEQQCKIEGWSQDMIECVVAASDNDDFDRCEQLRSPTPPATPVAATVDASCTAVGKHAQAFAAGRKMSFEPQLPPEKGELMQQLAKEALDELAAEVEKECTGDGWPDEVRRCYMGATTMKQAAACR
jgi:RNA polymerase sigma factor (sigma-70 family)